MTEARLANGTVLNFPDGTDPSVIQATVKKVMAAPADVSAPMAGGGPTPQARVDNRSILDKVSDYSHGLQDFVAGGLTGDIADEAGALGGSVGGGIGNMIKGRSPEFINEFKADLADRQQRRNQFKEGNPATAFAAELGGATVSPLTRALMGKGVPANASMTARVGSSALGGARTGAVYGAGGDEGDLVDRAGAAGKGALLGAALGGAAPAVVDATGNTARFVLDQTVGRLPFKQPDLAARKLAEALQRDGIDPNYYNAAEAKLNQIGQDAALMDVGPNSRGLARAAYTTPGEGKTQIGDFLTARQEGTRDANNVLQGGQAGRVTKQLDQIAPDFYTTEAGLNGTNAAAPLYDSAMAANQSVESPAINRILETPAGKAALKKAATTMQNDQTLVSRVDPEATAALKEAAMLGKADYVPGGVGTGLKLRTLDYVKRSLGSMESMAKRAGDNDEARILGDLRRGLTKELDKADVTAKAGPNSFKTEGGDYARARKMASDKFANQDALETGSNFMKPSVAANPQELSQTLSEMSDAEVHHFRIGVVQALKDKIGDMVTRADVTKKLMDVPNLEGKIRTAFGDDATFKKYIDGLKGEKAMFESYSDITKGSRTTPLAAEMADAKVDPSRLVEGARQIFMPTHLLDPVRGAVNVLGGAKDRLMMPAGQSRELAKLLTGQNTDALNRQMQNVPINQGRRAALARALTLTGGVGQGQ